MIEKDRAGELLSLIIQTHISFQNYFQAESDFISNFILILHIDKKLIDFAILFGENCDILLSSNFFTKQYGVENHEQKHHHCRADRLRQIFLASGSCQHDQPPAGQSQVGMRFAQRKCAESR